VSKSRTATLSQTVREEMGGDDYGTCSSTEPLSGKFMELSTGPYYETGIEICNVWWLMPHGGNLCCG
jgi:hypothetical protein